MTSTLAQETHQRAHRVCNEAVRQSADGRPEEVLPFICECDRDSCCATVWLPAAEYDYARGYALPILAAHHSALEAELPLADALDALVTAWLQTGGLRTAA